MRIIIFLFICLGCTPKYKERYSEVATYNKSDIEVNRVRIKKDQFEELFGVLVPDQSKHIGFSSFPVGGNIIVSWLERGTIPKSQVVEIPDGQKKLQVVFGPNYIWEVK